MAASSSHPQNLPYNGVLRGAGAAAGAGQPYGLSSAGSGPAGYPSRSGTPGGPLGGSRSANQNSESAASGSTRAAPPYSPRFTSPQPVDRSGRPSSPSKRGVQPNYSNVSDTRERWASISQMQNTLQHPGPMPPHFDTRYSSNTDLQCLPFGNERANAYPSDEPHYDAHQDTAQGHRDAQFGGYEHGFGHISHPSGPPGSMSPRSLMQFHHHHQRFHQQQNFQQSHQHPLAPQQQQHHQQQHPILPPSAPATNLGSGLMSNSGQPAEEITTIFIVGFPDDMTEREFANMFLFARGFEASTLKVPGGGPLPGSSGDGARSNHRGDGNGAPAGPGGPYHAVMPGSNMFDVPSNGGWDEHTLNIGVGRQINDSAFGLNALNLGENVARGMPPNAASAGKIKQIIGFAKFRSRAEALEARDALNGKKVDSERGCVLKTEMAKKNLHTKQRPVLSSGGQGPLGVGEGASASYGFDAPRSAGASVSSGFPSSFTSNGGHSPFDTFARTGGPPSSSLSTLSGMISPQGKNEPFGADFLRGSAAGSGISSNTRSGSSGEPTSAGARGGSGDSTEWASMGPLDYFGPPNEDEQQQQTAQATRQRQATLDSKASGTPVLNLRPHSQSQSSINTGATGAVSSTPRGPDWSAIGSPPSGGGSGGLFAGALPFSSSKDKPMISSTAAPFVPHLNPTSPTKSQPPEEDFGQGESTMSSTKKETGQDGDTSSNKTLPASDTSAPPSTSRSPRGPGNASPAFAARFGSLRLDSPATTPSIPIPVKSDDHINNPHTAPDSSLITPSKRVEEASMQPSSVPDSSTSVSPTSKGPKSPSMPDLPMSPSSRSFSIDQNPPGNTLFVGNLPASITPSLSTTLEKQLRIRFASCTGYRQLSYRLKNNGPMCFIEFDDVQNAAKALAEVNGDTMSGMVKNGGLRLSFSKNPLFRKESHSTGSSSTNSISPQSPADYSPGPTSSRGPGLSSLGKAGESLRDDPLDSANNLEDLAYSQGFSAGSSHGRLHGLFEGRQLGREKGFEIWDEVGFYQGTARFWRGVLVTSGNKATRKVTKQLAHIDALDRLISAFPMKNKSEEGAPPNLTSIVTTLGETADQTGHDDDMDNSAQNDGTDEELALMDMTTLLERIRARYKLMCASLGVPAKGLADETSQSSSAAAARTTATIAGRAVDTTKLRF